ncbi:hypothetical protein [Spiroplasma endosymbiont of Amphimallon solstitiale]|uniref:hypothetical protein n=1 Tax=Spiroplasma endosymbiont of Amphimallon solstitiale TaxID=3066288 RepID=UPI00313E473E
MQGTNGDHIRSLAVGPDGSIYAGDDDRGIIYKTDKISQTFGIFQQINDGHQIDSLVVDKDNTVFAGSWNGRLYKIKNGIYEVILETNPNHEVKRLVIDRDNNLFVGIDSNKVYKKNRRYRFMFWIIWNKKYWWSYFCFSSWSRWFNLCCWIARNLIYS